MTVEYQEFKKGRKKRRERDANKKKNQNQPTRISHLWTDAYLDVELKFTGAK